MDAFLSEAWLADNTKTVKDALVEKVAVIGENLNIRRFEKIVTDGCVVDYIHGGGRIGVLIEAEADVVNDEIKKMLKERSYAGSSYVSKIYISCRSFSGIHGSRERNPSCSS